MIPEFIIIDTIGNLLQNNIKDIFPKRNNKRFTFPTFPDSKSQLPQFTIEIGAPRLVSNSSNNFDSEEIELNGNYKEYYSKKFVCPVHIFCITQREEEITVVDDENNQLFLKNEKLNVYWRSLAEKCLLQNLDYLNSIFDNFEIEDISITFENNSYSWASDISCQVQYYDRWYKKYHSGELINEYDLTININD